MAKFTNPLENVRVASPCPANWDEMAGDERKRFCGQCRLNVYNLSGMTRDEAEKLLINAEGRLCVRFYRRADGSVLTKDCPVGWQAVKRRVSRTATAAFSFVVGLFGGLGFNTAFNQSEELLLEELPLPKIESTQEFFVVGEIAIIEESEPVLGKMIIEPEQVKEKVVVPNKKERKGKR